ncbi:MAG TPA: hypothetical protein VEC99_07985 [Clostridia bacterium]|nr:hypothetical protein [Clostridia bacterium]
MPAILPSIDIGSFALEYMNPAFRSINFHNLTRAVVSYSRPETFDRVVTPDEITCGGCSKAPSCKFGIRESAIEQGVDNGGLSSRDPCSRISQTVETSRSTGKAAFHIVLFRSEPFGHIFPMTWCWFIVLWFFTVAGQAHAETNRAVLPTLPANARLALDEDWGSGTIEPARWYTLRKKWGQGNNGVVPENVRLGRDTVAGREKSVLVCTAHGDLYDGPVTGYGGARTRVGGVLVSKHWFASGRFEVWMKIGSVADAKEFQLPRGTVPAIWTYGHRAVRVPDADKDRFVPTVPLYNPHFKGYGIGLNEYWSELDFPELGKNGDFTHGLYNTFCQNQYDWQTFALPSIGDDKYHCYTTEWRTTLKPLTNVTDAQVIEHEGFWWIRDLSVPFSSYLGNPLKRLGPNRYSVCRKGGPTLD